MKAVIRVDVPKFQIGQGVSVYFKDTMHTNGVCERDNIRCGECAKYNSFLGKCGRIPHPADWYCADWKPKE